MDVVFRNASLKFAELPPIFETEDYFQCIRKGNKFCMVLAKLVLDPTENSAWTEKLGGEREILWRLDRRYLHRGLCLQQEQYEQDETNQTKILLNNRLSYYNVTTDIDMIHCQDQITNFSTIDITFLVTMFSIFCFVLLGTIIDKPTRIPKNTLEMILQKFSVKRNWKNVTRATGNEDFNKLKSIQGFRVLTSFGVICVHTCMNLLMMYYTNPEILEVVLKYPIVRGLFIFCVFLVHIFLMISAFLFSNQIFNHYDKTGSLTFRDLSIFVINRYFRLYIPTLVFIISSQTSIMDPYMGVPALKLYIANKRACQLHWTGTLFFYNNFQNLQYICYLASWYLSADYQGYLILAIILYAIFKYRLNIINAMLIALFTSAFMLAIFIFFNDMKDIVYVASLRDIQQRCLLDIHEFTVLYSSTISTLPTSMTGMIFGYLYFKSKKLQIGIINKKSVHRTLWILFIVIQFNCVYISSFVYNKFLTAVLGSIIKVVYTGSIAGVIIALSLGLGGKMKKFLEGKYILILGNISFCTYLVNFSVMMFSNIGRTDLRTLSVSYAVQKIIFDVVLSTLGGLLFALTIEQPAVSLQKMFLPQIKKKEN